MRRIRAAWPRSLAGQSIELQILVIALIVAAGSGTRSGSATPKQFAIVAGRPMVAHAYAALSAHSGIDRVVVVIGANPTDGHPVFGSRLKKRLRQGAKLIVIDPRRIDLVK